jgi:hypothetical protein
VDVETEAAAPLPDGVMVIRAIAQAGHYIFRITRGAADGAEMSVTTGSDDVQRIVGEWLDSFRTPASPE